MISKAFNAREKRWGLMNNVKNEKIIDDREREKRKGRVELKNLVDAC